MWQDSTDTVLLTPTPSFTPLRSRSIEQCVSSLAGSGASHCVTPAIHVSEAQPFLDAGFTLRERLHLLSIEVTPTVEFGVGLNQSDLLIRHGRRRHEHRVLDLDNRAFDGFWSFNRSALKESLRATPTSRYRVAVVDKTVAGYAITGQASNRGYLQRLAVDPNLQGRQIGSALVYDALRWLQRRGATRAFVNTQETNTRAFGLYQRLGFVAEKNGLVVLSRDTVQP